MVNNKEQTPWNKGEKIGKNPEYSKFMKGKKRNKKTKEKISITNSNPNQIIIHHINGNHNDNRPRNRIILTKKEHDILHCLQGDRGRKKNYFQDIIERRNDEK